MSSEINSISASVPSTGPRASSPHVRRGGRMSLGALDISGITAGASGNKDEFSLEAFAGSLSATEEGEEGSGGSYEDFQAEVVDMQLRIEKLTHDNDLLKLRVKEAQEENFQLLQLQREEQSQQDGFIKTSHARFTRLEAELTEKKEHITGLEDKVTVLLRSNSRLEDQLSIYQKERKKLIVEADEARTEIRKIVKEREEIISGLESNAKFLAKEWALKETCFNEQIHQLSKALQDSEQSRQQLEEEKGDLLRQINKLKTDPEGFGFFPTMTIEHSFDLDFGTNANIETELILAGSDSCAFPTQSHSPLSSAFFSTERYDVATQTDAMEVDDSSTQCELVDPPEILLGLLQLLRDIRISHQAQLEEPVEVKGEEEESVSASTSAPVCDSVENGAPRRVSNGTGSHNRRRKSTEAVATAAAEQAASRVAKEIREELEDFRDQLKKSQELLTILRYKSSESLSMTKSCPGLALQAESRNNNDTDLLHANNSTKLVSCSTQTDSPVVETPLLAQKLNLMSPMLGDSGESGYDKLSDDGSVRVRDDLSVVLELSEQEAEGNCVDSADRMNGDKVGGGTRPRLIRMANTAAEDLEKLPDKHSSSGGSLRGEDRDDFVSVASSQGEASQSVYLSLERPLKVTLSGGGSLKGEDDPRSRSSSVAAFRSCHSSLVRGSRLANNNADSDTASVVSEGNTTFGSPFSSPSSPYWTPSQGSSSQETLTPLDGERTPVNDGEEERFNSASETCSPIGEARSESGLHPGRIPESKMGTMMKLAYDTAARSSHSDGKCLRKSEWRQLRHDTDLNSKEIYKKAYAQEEGNEDGGTSTSLEQVGGVNSSSQYAFSQDEEAELYLELMPNLANKLFDALDVLKDKRESPSEQDLQDLERNFNHMSEVFQTEHTNLEQRISALSKDFNDSQDNLKHIAGSLKSCLLIIKDLSKRNGPSGPCSSSDEDLVEAERTLSNISDEFEMYAATMCRNARRLGMMDVQNRLHRMVEVMVLYVHIIQANYENLRGEYDGLSNNFARITAFLQEKNIPFNVSATTAGLPGSYSLNNNRDVQQSHWDDDDSRNAPGGKGDIGDEGFRKYLQIFKPKKQLGTCRQRNQEKVCVVKGREPNRNRLISFLSEAWELVRLELFWPWNSEQTMNGLKQGFAVIMMMLGIFIFMRVFLPVNAMDSVCSEPSYFASPKEYFAKCGDLQHEQPPMI